MHGTLGKREDLKKMAIEGDEVVFDEGISGHE
jgi:hypothetical protein